MSLFSRKPKKSEPYDPNIFVQYASPMAANSARVMITRREEPRKSGNGGSNGRK